VEMESLAPFESIVKHVPLEFGSPHKKEVPIQVRTDSGVYNGLLKSNQCDLLQPLPVSLTEFETMKGIF